MFKIGLWGGIARIPIFFVFVVVMCLSSSFVELARTPHLIVQMSLLIMYAVGGVAVFGTLGNMALLCRKRYGLTLAGLALGAASLSYACWFVFMGLWSLRSIITAPIMSAVFALVLLARLAFLIGYGVALYEFHRWLPRPEGSADGDLAS